MPSKLSIIAHQCTLYHWGILTPLWNNTLVQMIDEDDLMHGEHGPKMQLIPCTFWKQINQPLITVMTVIYVVHGSLSLIYSDFWSFEMTGIDLYIEQYVKEGSSLCAAYGFVLLASPFALQMRSLCDHCWVVCHQRSRTFKKIGP